MDTESLKELTKVAGAVGEFVREQGKQAKVSLRQLARLAGLSNPYLSHAPFDPPLARPRRRSDFEMSVVTDVRTRAEDALGQGKQVLDSAQTRLAVTVEDANKFAEQLQGNARELAVRVRGNVTELAEKATSRDVTVAGKSVSIDALTADVEELVKRYRSTATERAKSLVNELKSDKRVSQLAERVENVYDALIDAVQDHVVKPVQDLIAKSPLANNSKVKTPAVPAPADETAPITPAADPSA